MNEGPDTRSPRRYRELAFRESDGVSIRPLWDSLEYVVFVDVEDCRSEHRFLFDPANLAAANVAREQLEV